MNEKINIAELLKDCPSGMELYSPIFGKVYLDKIRPHLTIIVTTDKYKEEFLYDGRYGMNGECMLFPSKDQRDWSKFQQPFKDGDIVATTEGLWIGITTGGEKGKFIPTYCVIQCDDKFEAYLDKKETWYFQRLASEEEKAKLFQAIKDNGYYWNAETKTLERVIQPKFKVGDKVPTFISNYGWSYPTVRDIIYSEFTTLYTNLLIEYFKLNKSIFDIHDDVNLNDDDDILQILDDYDYIYLYDINILEMVENLLNLKILDDSTPTLL